MKEPLTHKVKTYYWLKQQQKLVEQRLSELNKQIKEDLTSMPGVEPGENVSYFVPGFTATLTIKRKKRKLDEGLLMQWVDRKGLWDKCTKEVVDEDLIYQAYVEGYLTDDDLREISLDADIEMALNVEKRDVQRDNDGDRGRPEVGAVHDRPDSETT